MKNIYVLLQLLGLIGLVFFPIGTLLGIILILYGGIKYREEQKKDKELKSLVKCSDCAELIKADAKVCKHCGKRID